MECAFETDLFFNSKILKKWQNRKELFLSKERSGISLFTSPRMGISHVVKVAWMVSESPVIQRSNVHARMVPSLAEQVLPVSCCEVHCATCCNTPATAKWSVA